jgi:hypothetical protein
MYCMWSKVVLRFSSSLYDYVWRVEAGRIDDDGSYDDVIVNLVGLWDIVCLIYFTGCGCIIFF